MPSATILSVSIALAVIVVGFGVFLLKKNRADNQAAVRSESAETETVTPPVYLSGESKTAIQKPLYLEVSAGGLAALTAEQKKAIADFKEKILARVTSGLPLRGDEKGIIRISISTAAKPVIGSLIVADQTLFHFTPDELRFIDAALQK